MSSLKRSYENLVIAEDNYDAAIWEYLEVIENLPYSTKINNLDEIEEALEKIKKRLSKKRQELEEEG